jgi:hypothetical protein
MALTDLQLATYLLEVREVVQLMLGMFAEIRTISDRWTRVKESEDRQLAQWEAGAGLDDDTWHTTLWNRGEFQAQYFAGIEPFLAGWARLSLLLFPIEGKGPAAEFRAERGRRIREALAVMSDSILANRELRDSWMQEKLRGYLLSSTHPVGRFKARFFAALGYAAALAATRSRPADSASHAGRSAGPVDAGGSDLHNSGYPGPTGQSAVVLSVWFVPAAAGAPRFVTAYPGGAK